MPVENLDNYIWDRKSFPNKTRPDEDIILLVREDILIPIFKAIGLYLGFFLLLILRFVLASSVDKNSYVWLTAFDTFLYTLASFFLLSILFTFHNYYLSMQIITSFRIIDIDQVSLFKREVNSTAIEKIEDVTHIKKNLFNLLINYGDVIVQTAGRTGGEADTNINGFVFNNVPNPQEIANVIDQIIQTYDQDRSIDNAKKQAQALQKVLNRKTLN